MRLPTIIVLALTLAACKSDDLREKTAKEEELRIATLAKQLPNLEAAAKDAAARPAIAATDLKVPAPGSIGFYPVGDAKLPDLASAETCVKQSTANPRDVDYSFTKTRDCLSTYVGLVRVAQHVPPRIDVASKVFTPGVLVGDVLVYDYASGKYLGGVAFQVTNDEEVESYSDDKARELDGNLVFNMQQQVRDLTYPSTPTP